MRRWVLDFDRPDVEREFRRADDEAGLRHSQMAVWVALGFSAVYGVIDLAVLTEGRTAALVLRNAFVLPTVIVAGVMTYRSAFVARHVQLGSFVLMSYLSLALCTVLGRLTDLPTEYLRTSAAITLIGAVGLLRLRMPAATASVAVFITVALTLPGATASVEEFVRQAAPTAGIASIGLIVAYALEKLRRTAFLQQREVDLERRRSEELLYNVLPVSIADRLRTERGAIAESADDVSVLFSDIVGFTPLSESLPAEQIVALLDAMFSEFDRLCEERGIEKIKTVGDAYMAVAGLPLPHADHAAALAELALDMQRASTRLSDDWPTPIALRIGIASGPVVAGVIGQRKFTYDLWGDTVNTASRMESHGRPHRVQVSESTFRLLEHRYVFSEPQHVEVKGKGSMTTYFLLGAPA